MEKIELQLDELVGYSVVSGTENDQVRKLGTAKLGCTKVGLADEQETNGAPGGEPV